MRRAGQVILDQRRQPVEPGQQARAEEGSQRGRHAEQGHYRPIGLAGQQAELEHVVGEMHDRRGRDRQRRREEQRECGHQDRPQPEPREQRQAGGQKSNDTN
jgi:hypothetical protein